MSTVTIKIKRRASSGSAGAPGSLKSGELAFNENTSDKKLYYGYGDDGSGNATSIINIAGENIPNTGLANSSVTINANSLALGGSLTLDTDDIGEGSTNLYFTNTRARAALSATGGISFNGASGAFTLAAIANSELANSAISINSTSVSLGGSITLDSGDIGEGANLYYTDARARAAISATTATGFSYNNSTGVGSLASIPNSSLTNNSITINGSAIALGGTVTTNFNVSDGSTSSAVADGATLTIQGTANEVEVSNSSSTLTVGLPNNVTIGNDLIVGGDLTVNGTVTSVNSTTVTIDDKNIELGSTANPTDITADGGGLTLKGSSDKTITWVNSTDCWTFNQSVNITTGGLKIGGTEVITSSRVLQNVTLNNLVVDGGTF